MTIYLAIPKAITDIYWNGLPEKSEALGFFLVTPITEENKFGNLTIVGYKEIITGEKLINRISKNIDCNVKNHEQIGDIAWEITDIDSNNQLLSKQDLQAYMSQTKEQVQEKLQNTRANAKKIGQSTKNFETYNRYKKTDLNPDETYLAIPKAIKNIYGYGLPEKSEPLGLFCVRPITKKNIFGKQTITGFKEVITNEKIINRFSCTNEINIEYHDIDCMVENHEQIGDISWDIVDKSPVERLLPPEELQALMSQTKEQIQEKLQNIRATARNIGWATRNLEINSQFKKTDLDPTQTYLAIPKAITNISCSGFPEKSEPLGFFCVQPVMKKNIFGKPIIVGFKDTRTNEKIINRIPYMNEMHLEYYDLDCDVDYQEQIGDIAWEIVDKSSIDRLLPPERLQALMKMSPESVQEELQNIRNLAKDFKNIRKKMKD